MAAFFAPIAKWAARIDDARRIPEYVARAYRVATAGRPGPVVLAIPEDMLRDEVEALDRPRVPPVAETPDPGAIAAMIELLKEATNPLAIIGGADWGPCAGASLGQFRLPPRHPDRRRLPPPGRGRQSLRRLCRPARLRPQSQAPAARPRRRLAARRSARASAKSTTDGYKLVTPDHPGQTPRPRPPRPQRAWPRLSRRPADLRRHERVRANGRRLERSRAGPLLGRRARPIANGSNGANPQRRRDGAVKLDLGPCVKAMRDALPANTIICNGAGNFSGWWHRYWHYGRAADPACPDQRDDGLRPPRGGRGGAALQGPHRGVRRRRRRFPDERPGTGDRRAIWRRPARHPRRQRRLRHHPHAPGARISRADQRDRASPIPISSSWPRPMAAGPSGSRRPTSSPPRSLGRWSAGASA